MLAAVRWGLEQLTAERSEERGVAEVGMGSRTGLCEGNPGKVSVSRLITPEHHWTD